jgi:hypothetical protein
MLSARCDRAVYHPGEICRCTTNAEPPYVIRMYVDGALVDSTTDCPLEHNIPMAWDGCVITFIVEHEGESAHTHAHVET